MTDGEGNTTWYAYILSWQLAKVTDALGNETEYQYDAGDQLIELLQYGTEGSLKEEDEVFGMDTDLLETEWKKPAVPDHPLYKRPMGADYRNHGCFGAGVMIRKDSSLASWIRKGI